ncbi:restriction endonuclease subunit S [Aeromonas hydrophila]|uniref:restriction endonuclease subunit S n=1 Tax=Aeromonas hydrophila TaxID=644 RepID=UPI001A91559F|nr:restriction endonuclease subunit S [Aeromonas hydrophila]MBO0407061.1 restriction endonuclease subunit S [Aeromonas hydrophila]
MSDQPISAIADVNPSVRIPKGLIGTEAVSFIPMADVSESGQWINQQTRPLRSVSLGFTSFEEGDVLIAKITPCLENGKGVHAVGLSNGIGFGSTEFHVLRARPGINSRFLHHLCQWRKLRVAAESQMVGSAGQQRVQRQFFDEFRVASIGATEQSMIAQVLDTLDTAIHQTEAIIAKLKALKQGLLHDLLTRGIDANGELRPPQAEAPHLYKESPLGWIPKEWDAPTLGLVCSLIRDGTHLPPVRVADGPLLLSVRNMQDGQFILTEQDTRVSESFYRQMHKHWEVRAGDVLLAIVGATIGKTAIVGDMPKFTLQRSVAVLRGKPEKLLNPFLHLYMGSPEFQSSLWTQVNQTAQPGIYLDQLGAIRMPVPAPAEQKVIQKRLQAAQSRIDEELRMAQKLKTQKSGLMDDLLTGRVRVTPLLAEAEQQGSA